MAGWLYIASIANVEQAKTAVGLEICLQNRITKAEGLHDVQGEPRRRRGRSGSGARSSVND